MKDLEQKLKSLLSEVLLSLNTDRPWRACNLVSSFSFKHGVNIGFTPSKTAGEVRLSFYLLGVEIRCCKTSVEAWSGSVTQLPGEPSPKYKNFSMTFGFGSGTFVSVVDQLVSS